MQITFGWHLEGGPWSPQDSRLGTVTVGPSGLIGLLQTRLGLTAKPVSHSQRVLQYRTRLAAVDQVDAWHHESFQIAPWASAIEILQLRDELIAAGWRPRHPTNPTLATRLEVIRQAELVDIPMAAGTADHLAELHSELTSMPETVLGLGRITLADNRELLPAIWRGILDQLERHGVTITTAPISSRLPGASTVVVSSDGRSAAEAAARWIGARASRLEKEGDDTSTLGIVVTSDTTLLDWELSRRGLPQLGFAGSSPYRANEQLLPQLLKLAFSPIDPSRLADFLAVPVSPVPRKAGRALLAALAQEPGVGGGAWQSAISSIRDMGFPQADDTAEHIDRFFSTGLAERATGISSEQITSRCLWVIQRLSRLLTLHPELAVTIAQANELVSLVESLDTVSQRDLQQILESVVASGSTSRGVTGSVEQASSWIRVTDPSQLPATVGDVLWWGFDAPGASLPRTWDISERHNVGKDIVDGGALPDSNALNRLRADADRRLLSSAKDRLVLFREASAGLPGMPTHPLDDVLASLRSSSDQSPRALDVSDLVTPEGLWKLAGEEAWLAEVTSSRTGTTARHSSYGGDLRHRIERVSFSQLDTLIGCPRLWSLRYAAGIKGAPGHDLPEGDRALGTLAHKVVEMVFKDGPGTLGYLPDLASVERQFDQLVPHLAAELLLPGRSATLQRARTIISANVVRLFQLLRDREVRIVAIEQPINREFELEIGSPQVTLTGSVDVLGQLPDGRPVVIDLKWTRSEKSYRDKVEAGEALQLATYAWALDAEDVVAGYFLLRQGLLLTDSSELGDKITAKRGLEQVWEVGVQTARLRLADIRAGTVECHSERQQHLSKQALDRGESTTMAAEVSKMQIRGAGQMYSRPSCDFGSLGSLCGKLEGQG